MKKPYTVSKAGMEKDPTAARMVDEHYRSFVENGYRILDNWDGKSPFVRRGSHNTWMVETKYDFLDHMYRIRRPDKSIIYVSEPYHLYPDDFDVLKQAEADGWNISIDGHCLWFPGRTVRIMFSRGEFQE